MRALLHGCFLNCCLLTLLAGSAGAAEKKAERLAGSLPTSAVGLHSPVGGFLVEASTGQLRPVIGSAGSAILGDPVAFPLGVRSLSMSPSGAFAIAELDGEQPISVFSGIGEAVPSLQPLVGGFLHADTIEFSPTGSAAAVYSQAHNRIQVFRGLPGSPELREVDLSSLTGSVTALAVSDDGSTLWIGVFDAGSGGAVYRAGADNAITPVLPGVNACSIRFVPNSNDALMADAGNDRILLAKAAADGTRVTTLAGPDEGVDSPAAIALLSNRRTAVVINAGTKAALCINIDSGETKSVPLPGPATGLRSLRIRNGIAILTGHPASYWLLTVTDSGEPVLSLIPDVAMTASKQ
jgi:hypothetical protein